jgi:hypothetical protein
VSTTELTQVWLGLRPYVLIEAKLGPEGDDDLRLVIEAGGGPSGTDDIAGMLAMALAELPGGIDLMRQFVSEADAGEA